MANNGMLFRSTRTKFIQNLKIKLDNAIKISLETSIYIIVTNKKIKRNEIKIYFIDKNKKSINLPLENQKL